MMQATENTDALSRATVEVFHCDRDVAVGAAKDVFIVMWRDRTTIDGATAVSQALHEFCQCRLRELAVVTIVEAAAKMPDPGTRQPLAQLLRSASNHVLISTLVFEGDGFLAASVRGVAVGLSLLARQPYPHRVFKDVREAAVWFEFERWRIGKHFQADEVMSGVAEFRTLVAQKTDGKVGSSLADRAHRERVPTVGNR
jgi:hypothetical protein